MALGIYLSHPEVVIDPSISVPCWALSERGCDRAAVFARKLQYRGLSWIVSSTETKARETASIIGDILAIAPEHHEDMGENDRSATGFVPPERFEALANMFFAFPEKSVLGWETAREAQARIVGAVERVIGEHDREARILFVGHGAVGTLLRCALLAVPIARRHDQKGAGNAFAFSLASRRVLCEWTPIEDWEESQWPES